MYLIPMAMQSKLAPGSNQEKARNRAAMGFQKLGRSGLRDAL